MTARHSRNLLRRPLALFALLLLGAAAQADRPNVLLIICDDLNQEIGCYGNEQVQTPNIDRLAQRGLRFEKAYAQWPSCLPSRLSFLSGWAPPRTRVWSFDFDAAREGEGPLKDAVYLPQRFKSSGYTTARLDKVFHIGADVPRCWTITEEPWRDEQGEFKSIWTGIEVPTLGLQDQIVREGQIDKSVYPQAQGEKGNYQVLSNQVDDSELFDGHNAVRASQLLRQFSQDAKPFFLAVGFRRPHLPWIAPQRYFDMYPPESISLDDEGDVSPAALAERRKAISHYYAATTYVDAQVGKVLDTLRELELEENTIVLLFGDHGYCLGQRDNLFGKGNLWESSLRTALIAAGPGVERQGESSARPVALLDIYPTLLELCQIAEPEIGLDGHSFAGLLRNENAPWPDAVYSYDRSKGQDQLERSVRTPTYRYTEDAQGNPMELVRHPDLTESQPSLIGSSQHRAAQQRLAALLRRQAN